MRARALDEGRTDRIEEAEARLLSVEAKSFWQIDQAKAKFGNELGDVSDPLIEFGAQYLFIFD